MLPYFGWQVKFPKNFENGAEVLSWKGLVDKYLYEVRVERDFFVVELPPYHRDDLVDRPRAMEV